MSINGSVVTEEIISPYLLKQLVSCKRYVLVLDKIEQQVVFLRRKVGLFAVYELLRLIIALIRASTSLGEKGFTT